MGLSQFQNTINLTHASAGQNYIYFTEDLQFAKNGTGTRLKIHSNGNVSIEGNGRVKIYDMSGKLVLMPYVNNIYTWETQNLSSGIYFVKMSAGQFNQAQKIMLIK